jgi:hypothetical protein
MSDGPTKNSRARSSSKGVARHSDPESDLNDENPF